MLLTQRSGLEFIRFLFPLPFPRLEESTEGRELAFSFQGRRPRARAQTVRPQGSAILLFRCNNKRDNFTLICIHYNTRVFPRKSTGWTLGSRENRTLRLVTSLLLADDTRPTEIYPRLCDTGSEPQGVLSASDTPCSFPAFPAKRGCAQFPMLSALTDQGCGVSTLLSTLERVETSERPSIERGRRAPTKILFLFCTSINV